MSPVAFLLELVPSYHSRIVNKNPIGIKYKWKVASVQEMTEPNSNEIPNANQVCIALLNRNVLDVAARHCVCWTATGWPRTLRTSTTRSSAWIHSTRPFVVIQKSNGSASQSPSTVKCVASPRPIASPEVLERAMATARRLVDLAVPAGSAPTLCKCTERDKLWSAYECICTFVVVWCIAPSFYVGFWRKTANKHHTS